MSKIRVQVRKTVIYDDDQQVYWENDAIFDTERGIIALLDNFPASSMAWNDSTKFLLIMPSGIQVPIRHRTYRDIKDFKGDKKKLPSGLFVIITDEEVEKECQAHNSTKQGTEDASLIASSQI
jgi:hypothetical protein